MKHLYDTQFVDPIPIPDPIRMLLRARHIRRSTAVLLFVLTIIFVPSVSLRAQQVHNHDTEIGTYNSDASEPWISIDEASRRAVERTAREKPGIYSRMVEAAREKAISRVQSVGEIHNFFVLNRQTSTFDEVPALLVFEGRLARIWVDLKDTTRVSQNVIRSLARGLDTVTGSTSRNPQKGIIENNIEVFGETPKMYEIDGRTDFLLTDIQDGMSDGGQSGPYVAGYFSRYDQENDFGSNRRNLLYIDSRQGLASGVGSLLNTIAHEFQHLIQNNMNPSSEVFFNEGLSEVASLLCGYRNRNNNEYLRNTNVRLFYWNYSDGAKLLGDYERAMTFMYYLYEQYGEPFLTRFAASRSSGMGRVDQAFSGIGVAVNYQDALTGFSVANYVLSGLANDRYMYVKRLSSSVASVGSTYDTLFPATGSVALQQYAASYINLKNIGRTTVTFNGSRVFRVMAILYAGSQATDVRELESGQPYTFSSLEGYTRVVFSVVNLSSSANTVTWEAESSNASSVNTELPRIAGLSVSDIIPTPTSGDATVRFSIPSAAPVSLALYNSSGHRVRMLIADSRYAAGSHQLRVETTGLASGIYMLRLQQGGIFSGRMMIVTR